MDRIVVGVDGSATSLAALRWVAGAAERFGAGVDVIRAFHYPPPMTEWEAVPSNYGYLPQLPAEDVVERAFHDQLVDLAAEAFGAAPAVPVQVRVLRGAATDVLADASDGATLLVVGRRGHSGLAELLRLGSTATSCVEHAHCPVVVVPVGEPPAGEES